MLEKFTAISIFSGAGGFDLGMEAAGFETRLCIDIDYHSCRTLRQNRRIGQKTGKHSFLKNAVVLQRDIRKMSSKDIFRAARLKKGEVSLVYGGPPCQSFSVFGQRKGMDDPRGTLLWEYIRIIREIKPNTFIFENVAGLLTIDNGKVFQMFLNELSKNESGEQEYTLSHYLLDTSHFGVPQLRSRLIVFGTNNGVTISKPQATHTTEKSGLLNLLIPCPTVGEVLNGLPEPPKEQLPNHVGREHSERIIERYSQLAYGQRDTKTRINRLHPLKPSFTIVVGSDKGGGKGHVHPFQPREVTPRESARLQTFPDFWAFSGTSRHPIRQIGNAVPPVFGAIIGSHLMCEAFKVKVVPDYNTILQRLQLHYLQTNSVKNEAILARIL